MIPFLDILFTVRISDYRNNSAKLFNEISLYTTNFINKNLALLTRQNRVELWEMIFQLRSFDTPYSKFDQEIQKFLPTNI